MVEVLDPSDNANRELAHAAICFYDSNTLKTEVAIEKSCGRSPSDWRYSLEQVVLIGDPENVISDVKPTAAVTAGYVHSRTGSGNLEIGSQNEDGVEYSGPAHAVAGLFNGSRRGFKDSFSTPGAQSTNGDVNEINLLFRLKDFASASEAWQIRVVAKYYEDNSNFVDYELTSTETYTVAFRGSMTVDERPQQNFGEVFAGSQEASDTGIVKTGISTGKYRANGPAFISLAADTAFEDVGNDQNVLAFDNGASPATDKVSLGCKPDGGNTFSFYDTLEEAKPLFTSRDYFDDGDDVDALNVDFTTPTHDCTLYVGTEVAPATYSNSMVLAVGPE